MKKYLVVVLMVFIAVGCTMPSIGPQKVGVIHEKPLFFGKGGINTDRIVPTGTREAFWFTTDIVQLSSAPQTVTVHTDDVMCANKVPLDFDIAITLAPTNDLCIARMYKQFGQNAVGVFSRFAMPSLTSAGSVSNPAGEFMSYFRDGVRGHFMDEYIIGVNSDGTLSTAIKDLETSLTENINAFLKDKTGGCVVINTVSIGRANPPEEIKDALTRTAEQVQMVVTQRERVKAQEARKAAETASAEADKAQQEKLGFTNDEYLKKLELETVIRVCGNQSKDTKDNDGGRCTLIIGVGQNVNPVIQAK